MADEKIKVGRSQEICRLYRAFSLVQFLGIEYVRAGKKDDEKIKRATELANDLIQTIKNLPDLHRSVSDDGKCWDPVRQEYVDCVLE